MGNTAAKVRVAPDTAAKVRVAPEVSVEEEPISEHQWELPPPEASNAGKQFVLNNSTERNDCSAFNFDAVLADRRAQFSEECYKLPRGGYVVNTSEGKIQFGMPPDTIKDHLLLGLAVPSIFVLYGEKERRSANCWSEELSDLSPPPPRTPT